MKLVADLHIHSHYSRATSKALTFEQLARWAQLKGVHIVGTGDIAHPGWLGEMKEALTPAEEGLFRLKDEIAAAVQETVPPACRGPVRFILGGEISNIYKRDAQTRKVHNLVFAPTFKAVEKFQAALERIGNIRSDGRPILGLDSRDLLETALETDPRCQLIPAHIWTPWFSLLGSKSGFDSVAACFADLTPYIFALETGLSSDPPMNWRVSALDRYTLVSNSDAHSPQKLAREANLFDTELSYTALFDALKTAQTRKVSENPSGLAGYLGTVEFFPEEGKYHFDGHRKCGIVWDPVTTLAHNGICPVCGKPVTVGVMHRVETLADRPVGGRPARTHPFISLIPLPEVLGEVYGVGAGSKRVTREYMQLLGRLGPELAILQDIPLEDIAAVGGERLVEGIGHMRRGEVVAKAGYDGEFGVIRVFAAAGRVSAPQMGLFGEQEAGIRGQETENRTHTAQKPLVQEARAEYAAAETAPARTSAPPESLLDAIQIAADSIPNTQSRPSLLADLNPQQRAAVLCTDAALVIVAGPGTGKTRTLTVRIAYLILEKGIPPKTILAITFTNRAAAEMAERLTGLLGAEVAGRVTIKTFHAFGALLLREHADRVGLSPDFAILADEDRAALLRQACPELKQAEIDDALAQISAAKNRLLRPDDSDVPGTSKRPQVASARHVSAVYRAYEATLRENDAVDFDDLIALPIRLFEAHPDVLAAVQSRYRWISVDEYQDINQAQYRLLRLLAAPPTPQPWGAPTFHATSQLQEEPTFPPELGGRGALLANLCVIGDPDQAIYGFRGANPRYFLQFEQDYPGARVLHLSRNYRSTQLILDAAMQVIGKRRGGATPSLQAERILTDFADQVKLDVCRAATDKAEAEYVVHQIEQMVGGTSYFSLDSGRVAGDDPTAARSFADFAVLYRLNAQSRLLIEAFARSGIPYQAASQASLYEHKAVREVLAYLWLRLAPRSSVHLGRMLGAGKPAFSAKEVKELWELEGTLGNSLGDVLKAAAAAKRLNPAQRARLAGLAAFWCELEGKREPKSVARLIEEIGGFVAVSRGEPLDAVDVDRIRQLSLRAVPYGDRLADFLEMTALQSETDAYDPRADRVALMTLHAAKGLEFPVVFIVGCEEGLLPYMRGGVARPQTLRAEPQDETGSGEALQPDKIAGKPTDIDEERRLFYVGLTRAQQKLVLVHARTRFLFGQRMENAPSRFVDDIEGALKEIREMQRKRAKKQPEDVQLSLF